jgi:hypothetical protein
MIGFIWTMQRRHPWTPKRHLRLGRECLQCGLGFACDEGVGAGGSGGDTVFVFEVEYRARG